ncbi:protein NUCLEAR FUSION DEFECTIVE 6, mitochondrial-like isoform X3 [Salvia divinorum]|uniref:Protein NUCLEAR FUSION DEFECTIVE 6, mitochondrial-like isoform X3 n=1 Tax=Salvia divinorum TaxID=28513 RepID=A0ABD1HWG6_SALDI
MASYAARSLLRSAARISIGVKPRASPSSFCPPSQNPLSASIFRTPVEMSSVSVASMLPYHTATVRKQRILKDQLL